MTTIEIDGIRIQRAFPQTTDFLASGRAIRLMNPNLTVTKMAYSMLMKNSPLRATQTASLTTKHSIQCLPRYKVDSR